MSLDDTYRSSADMVREAAADDARRDWMDYQEQRLIESPEAEEARWQGVFARMAVERPEVVYSDRPGVDRRLFDRAAAVADGEIRDVLKDGAA
jgi:hypothetical protein